MAGANESLFAAVRLWVAENYPGASAAEVLIVLGTGAKVRLPVPVLLLIPPPNQVVVNGAAERAFVPTQLQADIIEALEGKALRKEALASAVGVDSRSLYRHPGGLRELQEHGIVAKHPRLGYYDPANPPIELTETIAE